MSWSWSRWRGSRHDLNGGEFRVVHLPVDNVEHSVGDREKERSLHRGKFSGYRIDIKILENSLPFYVTLNTRCPGASKYISAK